MGVTAGASSREATVLPPDRKAVRACRAALPLVVGLGLGACWRIGEPTEDAALVTWAAYPETVLVGEVFSLEFAGPVAPNACARLDTALLALEDTVIRLSARRSVFDTMCSDSPVSFYEARPLSLSRPGRYPVLTAEGRELGAVEAIDSGRFSLMRAVGEGTVGEAGGCLLFGPGWLGNQRPFALRGAEAEVRAVAGTDRRVHIRGTLRGFKLCGSYGSRPVIEVQAADATGRTTREYY